LTSALDGGEWLASYPGHFTPKEKAPVTPFVSHATFTVNAITTDRVIIYTTVMLDVIHCLRYVFNMHDILGVSPTIALSDHYTDKYKLLYFIFIFDISGGDWD
jgi:hypothetical protein